MVKPLNSGNLPDDDMKLMAKSKNFISSGGGFSKLVAALVAHNGGFVGESSVEEEIARTFRFKSSPKPEKETHAIAGMIPLCLYPHMASTDGCTSCWVDYGS